MYACFNLKTQSEDFIFESVKKIERWKNIGEESAIKLKDNAEKILEKYIKGEIIDGSALSEEWFEIIKSDVFISYSHNDEDFAKILSGWLKDVFNLTVFVDEVVWGSADGLLKAIDNRFCKTHDNTYDYGARNLTTSHVHAMLTTSILYSMDNAEVVIFLNTDNSVPRIENTLGENRSYTLSPWIYEEIVATNVLRRRDWRTYRKMLFFEHATQSPQIKYKLPLEGLKEITMDDLFSWETNYKESIVARKTIYGGAFEKNPDHPLNYLYSSVFGFDTPL